MGWIARAAGCALLLSATHADGGGRIAYPSPNQMYALLATDVRVTFGTVVPRVHAPDAVPEPEVRPPASFELAPAPTSLAPTIGFGRRLWRFTVPASATPSLTVFTTRTDSISDDRKDLFPEQQRLRMASPMDAMLTFSIGGSHGNRANLSLEGGVAGALWRMGHPLTVTPASL